MRRAPSAVILSIGLGLALVACASPSGSPAEPSGAAPSTGAAPSSGAEPSTGAEPSGPVAQSQSPAASEDGGGGGGSEAPTLANGPWTDGQGQTTISGALSYSTDAPLTTGVSLTEDGETLLAYNTDEAFVSIFIRSVGTTPFVADVTTNDEFGAQSRTCEVTYTRADDSEVDGSFSCVVDRLSWFSVEEQPTGTIMLEGSFIATR
jgi:hypothetical protein